MSMESIYFYSPREFPYGCFSNFSQHGFELDGFWWPTCEHYFQAQKFPNHPWGRQIHQAKTPKEAAKMGRDRRYPLRKDWEQVKDDIMYQGVLQKFSVHQSIRQVLLDTDDRLIIENSPIDYYWGMGADGTGKNRLGEILMEVRKVLRAKI